MSEDAPVNTGAVEWPSPDSAYFAVRRMQTKLHRWAGEDSSRRFGDLFNLVYDPVFLVRAWERVSTNKGARTAGIDQVTAAWVESRIGVHAFLGQIRDSLKSGEFTPVETRQVMIPKANGKLRRLGIPTIADRVVQASLKAVLEPIFEADFKPCSYGFRPNRRAHDAISEIHYLGRGYEWVLEADIKSCFDEISHTALMDRLRVRIKDKRICALVKAFLASGVFTELGGREETLTGTPQGGAISPLLANLFMHYAFDTWIAREFPSISFERYCDDAVVHCGSERQARMVRDAIATRLAHLGLELHPDKTRIVYCKDADRRDDHEVTSFTFLGYTFRPRLAKNKWGKHFVSFLPAVSRDAVVSMGREIRSWHIARRSDKSLDDLARMFNSIVQGWINYYGRFYKSMLYPVLRRLNRRLAHWACRKYKRLKRRERKAMHWLAEVARRAPHLFAHWRFGLRPDGWAMGAG